jgi:nucleotide-binding universal stress UspA family protein
MEIAIKKILCPVDFSESSAYALRYALAFAVAYDADLELLHVMEMPFLPPYSTTAAPDLSMTIERIRQESQQALDELVERNKALHPRVTGRMVVGTPFIEIINAAKEGGVDLVVVGTHGRTGLKQILIGSVAEKVVRKSPCPVLAVKHPEHDFIMP